MTIYEKLQAIQSELSVPKGNYNSFGKYKYRSCEDILEAVKPLVHKHGCVIMIGDGMVEIGGRIYIEAKATLADNDGHIAVSGFAREAENKKGMDEAQITGSASSYARKYALNGLFAIDDTKDSDATNKHEEPKKELKKEKPDLTTVFETINECKTEESIGTVSDALLKYSWTEEELSKIDECKNNVLSRIEL